MLRNLAFAITTSSVLLTQSLAVTQVSGVSTFALSGEIHMTTFDGLMYDYKGVGVFTALSSPWLTIESTFGSSVEPALLGRTMLRSTTVRIQGIGSCRTCEDPSKLEITFGYNIASDGGHWEPDLVQLQYTLSATSSKSANVSLADLYNDASLKEWLDSVSVKLRRMPAPASSESCPHFDSLQIQVALSEYRSVVISIAGGLLSVSTPVSSALLLGSTNGLCGLYDGGFRNDLTPKDSLTSAIDEATADLKDINNHIGGYKFAESFRVKGESFNWTETLVQGFNDVQIDEIDAVSAAIAHCKELSDSCYGAFSTDGMLSECVSDYAAVANDALAMSNFEVLRIVSDDAQIILGQIEQERLAFIKPSTKSSTTPALGLGISATAVLLIVVGVIFSNRRLKKTLSKELVLHQKANQSVDVMI